MLIRPRYEFKYVIDLDSMKAFQEKLEDTMVEDSNSIGDGYYVNSLYYDTEDLACYYEKIDGEKRRFKVRLRWYGGGLKEDDLSSSSFFMEVKHRNNDMNYKDRVKIQGKNLPEFFDNKRLLCKLSQMASEKDVQQASIIENLVSQKPFFPLCVVSYYRRALMCRIDPKLRITFDTGLRVMGPNNPFNVSFENGVPSLPKNMCVLEIKFNWAMPIWLMEICRESGLDLRRFSKYATSLERLHPDWTIRSIRMQDNLVGA